MRKFRAIDFEYGNIVDGVAAEHFCGMFAAVVHHNRVFGVGIKDDVLIGQDEARGVHDEA